MLIRELGLLLLRAIRDVVRIELIFLLQLGADLLMVCLGIHCLD